MRVRSHDVGGFVVLILFLLAQRGFFGCSFGFFSQQAFAVFARDLVIVGVDFAEGQKTMAIATIVDKCRLQ